MTRWGRIALLGLTCWVAASTIEAGTIYVNGTTGDDAWDGRCEVWDGGTCGPKATIQAGIDVALDHEQVLIADGIYRGPGNAGFRFDYWMGTDKPITVRSATDDPASCIVDCEGEGRGVAFVGTQWHPVVRGLTFRNGSQGVYCSTSEARLVNCVLTNNQGGAYAFWGSLKLVDCRIVDNGPAARGAGVYCYDSSGATLVNCLVAGNTATIAGGGIGLAEWSDADLYGCALVGNTAPEGAAVYDEEVDMSPVLQDCTIAGNTGGGLWAQALYNCIVWDNSAPQIDYAMSACWCDIQGGWSGLGMANIDADPLFVRPPAAGDFGDLRLERSSPCIDAAANGAVPADTYDVDGDGDTSEKLPFDLARQPRFHDDPGTPDTGSGTAPIVDMGAYEFQGISFQPGDLNCDGTLNAFDIDPFVLALADPAAYQAAYPDCDYMLADCDGDGYVNAFDIDSFVALLAGSR